MSDRTQDLKNLRAVATACKNYVDATKEQILWQVGQYNITTQDDNTTAYQKVVPTGATRVKIKSIEGNSEKSENLATFDDEAETTINGVKVKYQDGGIYLDGTASAPFKIAIQLKQPIYANQDYYVKLFTSGTTTATNPKAIGETDTDARLLIPSTTTFNVAYNINYFWFSVGANSVWTNYVVKPMLVSGSTAPTEWKQGYEGIHNIELSGLKVEGANLYDGNQNINVSKTGGTSGNIWTSNNKFRAGTYTLSWKQIVSGGSPYLSIRLSTDGTSFVELVNRNIGNTITYTFTLDNDYYIRFIIDNFWASESGVYFNEIRINRGSSDLGYTSYITPTTLPIDLTSIEDSGGNKLFADGSLKGVGTAKDYITPYKAHKEDGNKTYSSTDVSVVSTTYTNLVYYAIPKPSDYKYASQWSGNTDLLSNKYDIAVASGGSEDSTDMIGKIVVNLSQSRLFVGFALGTTLAQAQAQIDGMILVYPLATPIEADIDFSFLKNIPVYENGTITFENPYGQAVPSNITYRIEVLNNG